METFYLYHTRKPVSLATDRVNPVNLETKGKLDSCLTVSLPEALSLGPVISVIRKISKKGAKTLPDPHQLMKSAEGSKRK